MNKIHFLDTMILIKWLKPLQPSNEHINYIKTRIDKVTSLRVYKEASGYFDFTRKAMLQFIECVFSEEQGKIRPDNLHYDLINLSKRKFKDERDITSCQLLINHRKDKLLRVSCRDQNDKDALQLEISGIIQSARNNLIIGCSSSTLAKIKRFDQCPKIYNYDLYKGVYDKILSITNYEKDSLVLMDAYYFASVLESKLKNEVKIPIVTEDRKHILSKKTSLEEIMQKNLIYSFEDAKIEAESS